MTGDEKCILRESFKKVAFYGITRGGQEFFCRYVLEYPQYQNYVPSFRGLKGYELPGHPAVSERGASAFSFIDALLTVLDKPEEVEERLIKMGVVHKRHGIPMQALQAIYEPLEAIIKRALDCSYCSGVSYVWNKFIGVMLVNMQKGMQ